MDQHPSVDDLRDILLQKERESLHQLHAELDVVRGELMEPDKFAPKVKPILEARLEYMREHFPEIYGEVITATIKRQIRESKDEMIDALYPIAGRMIRKYIRKELQALSERIDQQISNAFSLKGWIRRITGMFRGKSAGEEIISNALKAEIDEVFIVERDSGLLVGSWSRKAQLDPDMVSGMMTAIRAFAEDAFQKSEAKIDSIEYESGTLFFQDLHSWYIAVLVSGVVSPSFESNLTDRIFSFAEDHLDHKIEAIDDEVIQKYSQLLAHHFYQPNEKNK